MVKYADEKVESGKLSKNRLIMPGLKRTRKWLMSITNADDGSREDGNGVGDIDQSAQHVDMGQSFCPRKDPEHLPPTNFAQRMGEKIRGVPGFFRSPQAAFGFRVAVATMSVAIIGFLHDTQTFFVQNRLLWAMIMVAISMTPTAGQSLFSFMLRILGTVIAMVAAFLVWYIPDSKTPGVLVFLWFFSSIGIYIPLKKPQFAIIGIIRYVTIRSEDIVGSTIHCSRGLWDNNILAFTSNSTNSRLISLSFWYLQKESHQKFIDIGLELKMLS